MQTVDSAIARLSDFFNGWRVELIQLGPHREPTLASSASSRSHRILRLHAGNALAVRGTVHKACSCVVLSTSQQAVRLLGQPLGTSDLMLAGAGAAIDLFVPSGAELFILVVESGAGISGRGVRICQDADESARAVARLAQWITEPDRDRSDVAETLATHVRRVVTTSRIVRVGTADPLRVSAVVSACRLVERRLPAPITLTDLSRHCGVAERTLEYGFQQVYDTTPLAFVRSQRLTRSRTALLHAAASTSISETARALGFTHMGQYSRDYRRLFGETPSMTLARGKLLHEKPPRQFRVDILPSNRRTSPAR